MRTHPALKVFLVILLALAGVSSVGRAAADDGRPPLQLTWTVASATPLIFGVIPTASDLTLSQEFAPLAAYLGHHLKCGVKLVVAQNYPALAGLLDSGEVEIARFSAISYETLNRADRWEVLCRPMISGKVFSRGVFVSLASGPVRTLEDLRGKRFAFVEPTSGSGFVKAREFLKGKGIDPLTFFGHITFSGNHSASLNGLRAGLYEGVVVYENAWGKHLAEAASAPEDLCRLGFTDWILTDPIVVRKDMPLERKKALVDLFVNMRDRELGASASAELKEFRDYDGYLAEEEIRKLAPPKE